MEIVSGDRTTLVFVSRPSRKRTATRHLGTVGPTITRRAVPPDANGLTDVSSIHGIRGNVGRWIGCGSK
jgi:hypothetical protein